MGVLLVKNLFKGLQWHNFLEMFYGYGSQHHCSQHHSLQCDGWWLRKAIRIPPAAGTTVMETCKPGSWSLLAGTHAINFHADVGKKHFTLRGILSGWFVVVNKDSDYHMTTRASVSFTCFEVPSGEGVRLLERDRFGSIWVLNDGDASSTSKWT